MMSSWKRELKTAMPLCMHATSSMVVVQTRKMRKMRKMI
jgi:hypothetical protein